ncbi:MAG: lysophospholipase, partial [Chloroflexota bacterium]
EGQLYWQAWKPDGELKALLVIAHGFDDHSARYAHVADHFGARGYAVYTFDQIGHGQSAGPRGHVESFEHYVEDLNRFVALAQTQVPDVKSFVLGHSQGGMVSLRYGIAHPHAVSGIVTSGAGMMLSMSPPRWKVTLGKVLSNVAPRFALANGIPPNALSRDPAVAAARQQDPHRHGVATTRWADEFFKAQADTLAAAPRFTLPCLLLHGGADPIINPEATKQFFAAASSTDKTMKIYDGMYHEIYNEVGKEQVLADVEQWIDKRLNSER